jgi:hypothetical protein
MHYCSCIGLAPRGASTKWAPYKLNYNNNNNIIIKAVKRSTTKMGPMGGGPILSHSHQNWTIENVANSQTVYRCFCMLEVTPMGLQIEFIECCSQIETDRIQDFKCDHIHKPDIVLVQNC